MNRIKFKSIILVIVLFATIFTFPFLIKEFLEKQDIYKEENNAYSSNATYPKGLRLTSNYATSHNITLTWYTESVASDPKVLYSKNPNMLNNITVIPTIRSIDSSIIYTAHLSNLESNTTHFYQVKSNVSIASEILNFTTTNDRNKGSLKFLILGDSRTQRTERHEIAKKIMDNIDDIEFTIHTGDIVSDGRIQTQWNDYFEDIEILSKNIPGYYIEGNHEHIDGKMYENIPQPKNILNEYYYSFNLGPVKFIGLNTNREENIQTSWLESELKQANLDNETFWKVVYMHEPIFNSRLGRTDRNDLIATWSPLFDKYGVDLVFAGHNHYYERSYPMNNLKEYDNQTLYDFINPFNPMYFITGGAGAPLYTRDGGDPSYLPPRYTAYYNSSYHFVTIEVKVDDLKEETILLLETWAIPEEAGIFGDIYLIDNMTITKKGILVNVNSPNQNDLFGRSAPGFNVTLSRRNLNPDWYKINSTWYTLDDGLVNYTFNAGIGVINQSAWDLLPSGTVNMRFYAKDTNGCLYYSDLIIKKDVVAPQIIIDSPKSDQIYGNTAPFFNVTFIDANLNAMWYTIDRGLTNFTIITNGSINQMEWEKLLSGYIIITFYANDSLGNLGYQEILIEKKITELKNGTNNLDIVLIYGITIIALIGITSVIIIFWRRKLT